MTMSNRPGVRRLRARRPLRAPVSRDRPAGQSRSAPPPSAAPQMLLAGTFSFLLGAGCSKLALSQELERLRRDDPERTVRRLMAQAERLVAGVHRVMRQWCQELPYVHHETGTPRALHFEGGEPSLQPLLLRHFPSMPAREALGCLEEQGAVVRLADGRYAPVQRWHGHSWRAALELAVLRSCCYLQAALSNLMAQDSTDTGFDRATATVRLPLRLLPEFRRESELQLRSVVDMLDSWLMDREAPDDSEPSVRVGVHCYVHLRPGTPETDVPRRHK